MNFTNQGSNSFFEDHTGGVAARDTQRGHGFGPELVDADTLVGSAVWNHQYEDLGQIKSIMLDIRSGQIAYAVLSFGGSPGLSEKLFAIPWNALMPDAGNRRFLLDVARARLHDTPGFDKDDWPDRAHDFWPEESLARKGSSASRDSYEGTRPYTTQLRSEQVAGPAARAGLSRSHRPGR
ncbi:MAG TPA: PRC-barrel domain-containing protein [Candidatus Accumulibacter phosphatis]|nr:MAG: PRC-barrel domain protein [Candidatus Accumulibacter sp. SK-11]HAY26265.1 photosystem reaction center subunit H [Accumulibacter sp.]HCN69821.1 photosystem reaction center subunit H [Accumulibacter sp.]HRL76076.1 PRC-barrel domain-containing protein [Candidatus Accumulibacter phosphatis]HRQ94468.1 PRC-barrel domain-containing protein [Candidatus Accumulibacter phosphatis]